MKYGLNIAFDQKRLPDNSMITIMIFSSQFSVPDCLIWIGTWTVYC